jgi:hypothetical protein
LARLLTRWTPAPPSTSSKATLAIEIVGSSGEGEKLTVLIVELPLILTPTVLEPPPTISSPFSDVP